MQNMCLYVLYMYTCNLYMYLYISLLLDPRAAGLYADTYVSYMHTDINYAYVCKLCIRCTQLLGVEQQPTSV